MCKTIIEKITEIIIPIMGARKINDVIFITSGIKIAPIPAFAVAAPTNPPTIVCDELDGIPHHQVNRFQIIAARRPLPITVKSTISGLTIPFPTVVATCNPKIRNAIKLKNAAQTTATLGVNTCVDTTVAIEFAASWKPLMKSNTNTKNIIIVSSIILFYTEVVR
jgi:hypothetical protein